MSLDRLRASLADRYNLERELGALAAIPAGRFAGVEDIACMVALLASDALAYVNGATIPVDGGYLTR